MPRIPNRRDDDREPIAPAPTAEAAPAAPPPPMAVPQPMGAPAGDPSLPPSAADGAAAGIADPAAAGEEGAPLPASAPLPPIIPTEAHEAEADLLLADAEDPPRAAPARGWRADAQRVYRMVSDELLLATGGKRLPTIEEIDRAIEGAVARTTAQHREPEAGPMPAAPISAPEIEAATNRLAAEALDPAWADDPEAVARSRRWVRDMLDSGASEDEVQGMLAETGTRDWLNRYAAKLGDGWDDEGPGRGLFQRAAYQVLGPVEPGAAGEALPEPQQEIEGAPPPASPEIRLGQGDVRVADVAAMTRLRDDLADPVKRRQYISDVGGVPSRLNGIVLTREDYRLAVADGIWSHLWGIDPVAAGKAGPGAINTTNKDSDAAGEKAKKDAKKKKKLAGVNIAPVSAADDVRKFVADIARITTEASLGGTPKYEKYMMIGRRVSDGELVIVAIGTGGELGGNFSNLAGSGSIPMPAGIELVAAVHTHPDGVVPEPYMGDPSSVWMRDVPMFTIGGAHGENCTRLVGK